MLATLSKLPKWLAALVALCVLTGYAEQVKCKLIGCKPTVAAAKANTAEQNGEKPPTQGEHDCDCQCHFLTLTASEVPAAYVSFLCAVGTQPPLWFEGAPEAPCADIEHPPQLA